MHNDYGLRLQKIDDCRRLFMKHDGQQHELIQKEMRELGYHDFHRRSLYRRFERGRLRPGWIERYGWQISLRELTRKDVERIKEEEANAGTDSVAGETVPALPATVPSVSGIFAATPEDDFDEFRKWLKLVSPSMTWDWKHQVYIYRRLRRVTDGQCTRLMIFLPPRHGKSELVTVRYAAWRLKRDPTLNIILGSYNQRLANRFSRKVRNVLIDDAAAEAAGEGDGEQGREGEGKNGGHASPSPQLPFSPTSQSPFPFTRQRQKNSEAEWSTAMGGGLKAVGVGAGVTGYGAGLIIIDDPVKSRAEAESETYREKIWDWFNDDLYTRLEPNGAIILIQTRWHEDDLAGRLLRDMREEDGEHWDVIDLPALAEVIENGELRIENEEPAGSHDSQFSTPNSLLASSDNSQFSILNSQLKRSPDPLSRKAGEALCPERFDAAALERVRRRLGSYSFAALYQQRPVPAEGGLFKRSWFRVIDRLPPDLRHKKRGWDLGISKNAGADYTASLGVGYDRQNNMYIYDGIRRQIEYPEQRRLILGRLASEPGTEQGVELSANGHAVIQDLRREPRLRGRALRGVKVKGDKVTRALSWIALAEEGRVFLIRGPWLNDFLDEICSFPSGTHDDQVDAVSIAVQMHKERLGRLYFV